MSQFYDNQSSTQTQIRQKITLDNLINQKYIPKSKQSSRNLILIQSKPYTCRDKINQSQNQTLSTKLDLKNSLLQDIGNIDLEIQKMTEEYQTSLYKTQIINNGFIYFKVLVPQLNQKDVSKSNHKISINKIKNSNYNQQTFSKLNKISEISYSKLAESIKNYSNQKKLLDDKIKNKPKIQPYNIIPANKQSNLTIKQTKANEINNSQNLMKSKNPKDITLTSKINSERNKNTQIKPILKQTSSHTQNFNQNAFKLKNEIKNNIKDDHYQLDKAVKIFNTLKQLVNQNSLSKYQVQKLKDNKNQIHQ